MDLCRVRLLAMILCAVSSRGFAGQLPQPEAAARGFPELRDLQGRKLADGDFAQWLEHGQLHVRIRYDFGHGDAVQEDGTFEEGPLLAQNRWSWVETQGEKTVRRFEVDFKTGAARADVFSEKHPTRSSEKIKIEPGRTFSGFGFTLAIKSVRERLLRGEKVEFEAIAFSPKPREVRVEVSYGGLNEVPMSGRKPIGECFVIHPKVPALAKLFVSVPNTKIWLTHPPPAEFLRWEGSLAEPDDPVVRVDLLPGGPSGAARPAESAQR